MSFTSLCPRCGSEIKNAHSGIAVCGCGWSDDSHVVQARVKAEKNVVLVLFLSSMALVLAYVHMVSWGSYAFQIPFTRAAQMTGMLSPAGYEELATACIGLNKFSCAESALLSAYQKSNQPIYLAKLARFQVRQNKIADAHNSYNAYFKAGGQDGEIMIQFAKVLEIENQNKDAIHYYKSSIAARPEVLPIQATSGIVRILMKEGRYKEAYARIIQFHGSAGNAKGYLNTELTQLKMYLSSKAGTERVGQPNG